MQGAFNADLQTRTKSINYLNSERMKAKITDNNVLILTAQTTDDELMLSKWIEKNSGATANYAIDINSEVNGDDTSNDKCILHGVSKADDSRMVVCAKCQTKFLNRTIYPQNTEAAVCCFEIEITEENSDQTTYLDLDENGNII